MAKAKSLYTLTSLRTELGPACAMENMTVPSLISLKNWSARGDFKRAHTVQDAIKVVIEKMSRNRGAYQIPDRPISDHKNPHSEWLQREIQKRQSKPHPRDNRPPMFDEDDDGPLKLRGDDGGAHFDEDEFSPAEEVEHVGSHLAATDDSSQRLLLDRLSTLEGQMRMLRHEVQNALQQLDHHAALSSGKESIHPAISKTIEQLDAVRKHLMQRMDAELQLIRSQSSAGQTGNISNRSVPSASVDDLTGHRILVKLARIESMLTSTDSPRGQIAPY